MPERTKNSGYLPASKGQVQRNAAYTWINHVYGLTCPWDTGFPAPAAGNPLFRTVYTVGVHPGGSSMDNGQINDQQQINVKQS